MRGRAGSVKTRAGVSAGGALSRRGLLAAAGGTVAALATGCGSDKYVQVVGSVPRDFRKRLHVVYWHSFGADLGVAMDKLIDEFNDLQDEIFVEGQFQGSYETTVQKLSAALIARQIPDIVNLSEVTWRKMHLADKLEPLNDYFVGDYTPDLYMDNFINEGTVKDTVWWIPFARSTPLFYFNKDVFGKAGLPETGPANWRDLKDWAPALQEHTKYALALAGIYASWYFQGNVWQWGGRFSDGLKVTLDDEKSLEAGHWMVDLVRKDKAAYLSADSQVDFTNEVTACAMLSTGSLASVSDDAKFDVGTTFLPEYDGFGCPTGGSGIGVMRDAAKERKDAAMEFLRWLSQPEKSAQWTIDTGYMPVAKAAQQEQALLDKAAEDPNYQTALNQLPKTKPQDLIRPIVPSAGEMMDTALQKLYSSADSVEDVFARLNKRLQRKADLISETYEAQYR
jgi:sn-glycerol 3-phosphate transport system substrate-binding protein